MNQFIRKVLSIILPRRILGYLQYIERKIFGVESQFRELSNKEIFTKIYEENWWGSEGSKDQYCSGSGSHSPLVVKSYVDAVGVFLDGFSKKKILIDLGCGDFNVGSKIAPMSLSYIACDIVEKVIVSNRSRFKDNNVDFRVLDLTNDPMPIGDIVFARQVLQHLSNDDISKFVKKVKGAYSHLVLSEHLPRSDKFVPNLDKPSGSQTRLFLGSGIDVTEEPFSLEVVSERVICEVEDQAGVIRTTVYQL